MVLNRLSPWPPAPPRLPPAKAKTLPMSPKWDSVCVGRHPSIHSPRWTGLPSPLQLVPSRSTHGPSLGRPGPCSCRAAAALSGPTGLSHLGMVKRIPRARRPRGLCTAVPSGWVTAPGPTPPHRAPALTSFKLLLKGRLCEDLPVRSVPSWPHRLPHTPLDASLSSNIPCSLFSSLTGMDEGRILLSCLLETVPSTQETREK